MKADKLEMIRVMTNVTTANTLAMRGLLNCLLAGIEPTDEAAMQFIRPLLTEGGASGDFAALVEGHVQDMLTSAELLRASPPGKPPSRK